MIDDYDDQVELFSGEDITDAKRVIFEVEPYNNYVVKAWYLNGEKQEETEKQYIVNIPKEKFNVEVEFVKQYMVNVGIDNENYGTVMVELDSLKNQDSFKSGMKVNSGTNLTAKVKLVENCILTGWEMNGEIIPNMKEHQFQLVIDNKVAKDDEVTLMAKVLKTTGIQQIEDHKIIYVKDNQIRTATLLNDLCIVYDMNGNVRANVRLKMKDQLIGTFKQGVYLVKIGLKIIKVLIE